MRNAPRAPTVTTGPPGSAHPYGHFRGPAVDSADNVDGSSALGGTIIHVVAVSQRARARNPRSRRLLATTITEVALAAGQLFLVNVTMNRDREVTGVFAGDLLPAHAAGCEFARRTAMTPVPHPFDIVITTNSGYPLDQNLYQAVKGMSAAAQIVKPGGAIIIAAECADGIPDHGKYGELLRGAADPAALLETISQPGFLEQDQWEAQVQAQILLKAEVYLRTDNLTRAQIETALLKPCGRIEDTVAELLARYGSGASLCVLPEGPQTIPFVGIRTQER